MLKSPVFIAAIILLLCPLGLFAHGVDDSTKQFLLNNQSVQFVPFLYIGAKHMVTGYDHLLFLFGVLFFLTRNKDVLIYVSLFTLGHSLTLLTGVLSQIYINPYLIDAIIGFSVFYKGFENLGGFKRLGYEPDNRTAVMVFGLFHGFGLASKLQDFQLHEDSLLGNLIAFNLGVEIGQVLALSFIFIGIQAWRRFKSFKKFSVVSNTLLMSAGLTLIGYQLTGYFVL
mgnify:CR=1 FL=1